MSLLFQVYSRPGCHLCEDMIDHLNALKEEQAFRIEVIEITGNSFLEEQYGLKVPVLMHDDQEICRYFLDVTKLNDYLTQNKTD